MGDGIVLIRGAAHTAACWQPTVTELARSAPDLPVLAVDLPGRGDTPEDLRQVTAKRCVEHVVERIEAARVDRVVVVAHSMGRRTNVRDGLPRRAPRPAVARWMFCNGMTASQRGIRARPAVWRIEPSGWRTRQHRRPARPSSAEGDGR